MQDGYDSELEHNDDFFWLESRYGLGLIGRTVSNSDADEVNQFTNDEFQEDEHRDPRAYSQMWEDELSSDEDEPVTFDFDEKKQREASSDSVAMDVPDGFDALTERPFATPSFEHTHDLSTIFETFEYPR